MEAANLGFDFTDPATLTRVIGIAVPLLIALITKKVSSSGLKSTLNIALSAIGGSVAYLTTAEGALDVGGYVNAVLNTFTTSIVAYYGVLKPTGITDSIAEKTKDFGIGTPPAPELETADKGATDEGEAIAEALTEPEATPVPIETLREAAKKIPAKKSTGPAKKVPVKKVPVKRTQPPRP